MNMYEYWKKSYWNVQSRKLELLDGKKKGSRIKPLAHVS